MYCKALNCLFVHIPKTAGKSIEHFLLEAMTKTWDQRSEFLLRKNTDPAKGPEQLSHLTAAEYTSLGHLGREEFKEAYRFAFVRNPWARLVSEYFYRGHQYRFTFESFIENLPLQSGISDECRHVTQQSDFVFDENGKSLVNFVGRFENLNKDFDYVCGELGLPCGSLRHIEVSGARRTPLILLKRFLNLSKQARLSSYREYYSKRSRRLVAERYAADIENFGYRF